MNEEPVLQLLRSQFQSLDYLGSSLEAREWHAPASLPGWAVIDVYAHIIGTESMLDGAEVPDTKIDVGALSHVHNKTGVINETWIESLSDLPPDALLDRFRTVTSQRLRAVETLTATDLEAERATPSGPVPYARLLRQRVFDCWMHEQDIRQGLDRPGHESGPCARAAVDEAAASLATVLGSRLDTGPNWSVTIDLTGPVRCSIHLHPSEAGTAGDDGKTIATVVSMSSILFMRLAGGRSANLTDRYGGIDFNGDLDLAQQVTTNLTVTY